MFLEYKSCAKYKKYQLFSDLGVQLCCYLSITCNSKSHFQYSIGNRMLYLSPFQHLIMCKQIAQKRNKGVLVVEKGDKIMGNTLNIFIKFSLVLTVAVPAIYVLISFSNMVESSETGKNGISMARYTELTGEQF